MKKKNQSHTICEHGSAFLVLVCLKQAQRKAYA